MESRPPQLVDYAVIPGPLLWWGGIAALARVLAATGGTPEVGDLWATVPFVLIGLLLVAVIAFRFGHLKLLMWVTFILMVVVSVGVGFWRWNGWGFYLATAVFIFAIQILVIRAARTRSGRWS